MLVVDLHGVLWLIGRRRLGDLAQVSSALHPVIWGGLIVSSRPASSYGGPHRKPPEAHYGPSAPRVSTNAALNP